MTRLIDADALIDRIESDKKQDNISPGKFFLFKAYIMNAPTIEPDGDTISRQDAIAYFFRPYSNEELYSNTDIEKALNALPSAPDSRQRGEWVRKYDGHINCYWYECDQCGEYRPRNQFGHEYNANFCPNCGADMRGGEDE